MKKKEEEEENEKTFILMDVATAQQCVRRGALFWRRTNI